MPLEDLTGPDKFIDDLNPAWPLGSDPKSQGDNHIRGIKNVLDNTLVGEDDLPLSGPLKNFYTTTTALTAALADYLPLAGGTLTGPLDTTSTVTLAADPIADLEAAPKQYVDSEIATAIDGIDLTGYLEKAGGTMTGPLAFADGAVATPGLAPTADPTTGFYWTASAQLGVAVGGATAAVFDAGGTALGLNASIVTREKGDSRYLRQSGGTLTGQLTVPDGTSSSQGIRFASAGSAGLYLNTTGNWVSVAQGNNLAGRFDEPDTTTSAANTVITRQKGDARYQSASSIRFKVDIGPANSKNSGLLIDDLVPKPFVWGGEIPATDERYGRQAYGLIAEEVLTVFPEAVTYQKKVTGQDADEADIEDGVQVQGLDPLALCALLVDEVKSLRARVDALENL